MTTEATTPAAAEATPAAAAPAATVTAAAPAAATTESLMPANDAAPAAAAAEQTPATAPATPPAEATWFYADGTPGKGEMPSWYLADKYKTVEAQAQAYPELAKRFGAFVGAPKDGKYEFKMPDGIGLELVNDHPLLNEFQAWANKSQLSQEGYQELIGMLSQYEAAQVVDLNVVKQELGPNADDRINAIAGWAKANLAAEEYAALREATSGRTAAAAFKVIEAAINKTRQVTLPKPGADVMAAQPTGLDGVKAMMEKRDANGRLLYMVDQEYRKKVEAANLAYHQSAANQ